MIMIMSMSMSMSMRSLRLFGAALLLVCSCTSQDIAPMPKVRRPSEAPIPGKKPPMESETLASCPDVEPAMNVINQEKMTIHASDEREFIVTSTVGVGADAVVHITAVDRKTGAKRTIAELLIVLAEGAPVLVTSQTIFVSESRGAVHRIARSGGNAGAADAGAAEAGTGTGTGAGTGTGTGGAPVVAVLPSSRATLAEGEYVYGIDQHLGSSSVLRFRVKIGDLETMTAETSTESPLIELAGPDPFVPYLAAKSALYLRALTAEAAGAGAGTDLSMTYQPTWDGPQTPLSTFPTLYAAINEDSIFFIDTSGDLKQKLHGSTIPLTVVARDLIDPKNILADQNHIYFNTPDTLARVTTTGEAKRIVNAIGTWWTQDSTCVYVRGTTSYTALAK